MTACRDKTKRIARNINPCEIFTLIHSCTKFTLSLVVHAYNHQGILCASTGVVENLSHRK